MDEVKNILLVGVGGQGTILASKILSEGLAEAGYGAKLKGYESPVTGDADILLMPDMTSGNIPAKALRFTAGAKMAGIIVGTKAPIVLVSRGASAEEKYLSMVLAAASVEKNKGVNKYEL